MYMVVVVMYQAGNSGKSPVPSPCRQRGLVIQDRWGVATAGSPMIQKSSPKSRESCMLFFFGSAGHFSVFFCIHFLLVFMFGPTIYFMKKILSNSVSSKTDKDVKIGLQQCRKRTGLLRRVNVVSTLSVMT